MIRISNDRIAVQIQTPGTHYTRSRFDWSGICQQITLDGVTTFCSQEATVDDPGTEGTGLVDEFGINTPIGYDQVGVGDWFPKIGIGFLKKSNSEPYDFFSDYDVQPVPFRVKQDSDSLVSFLQESESLNGWSWRLGKTFMADGPGLVIDYSLENTGEKPLNTEQYNHNFIAIDAQTVGPDYHLAASFPFRFDYMQGGIQTDGCNLSLTEVPSTDIYAAQLDCADLNNVAWKLVHQPLGHGVQVKERFPLFKFALWGRSHVISPEFFIWIDIQPGQTQTWQRRYTFF